MAQAEAHRLVEKACSRIKKEDIVHRGFLRPIEIALKTYKSEVLEGEETNLKPGSLPAGLKIAVKPTLDSDVHFLTDVEEIKNNPPYSVIKENTQDNMLALMKCKEGLELAICICMYSEDKKMLKNTLAGVSQNIANIVALEGMDPDKIGVFVIMDGIQKVDSSIVDYFEQLQRSSNINLGTNIAPSLTVPELAKRTTTKSEHQINEEQMKNVNNFLFDVAELEERNRLRFEAIKVDYNQKQSLLDQIHKLKKGKPLYQDLPASLYRFFLAEAKNQRKIDYNETDEQVNKIKPEEIIDEYTTDVRRMRPLVGNTLREAEKYCRNYLNAKQDLGYLAYFRRKVKYSLQHIVESGSSPSQHQENTFNQEIQHAEPSTIMNLFLCVKYKNSGKLSSHNWFFNGFCKELRPKYAVLLDVGLRPQAQALMRMYNYMKQRKQIGGVCGYMSLKIQKQGEEDELKDEEIDCLSNIATKFVDIQRTQQVEYHFAHLMDKPFEASFGFIHVLPGAFSAYNMEAIIKYDAEEDDELLKAYFKSIDEKLANRKVLNTQISAKNALLRTLLPDTLNSCCITVEPESDQSILYDQNVYLAEDRILCMGIHKKGFDMAYLPDAYAFVDPMKTVHGLLGQRKRWINGSYFAFEKVKRELAAHEKENGFECMLNLQLLYLSLNNALAYFSPSLFLFTVHIAMEAFRADVLVLVLKNVVRDPNTSEFYNAFVYTMDFIYAMLVGTIVFYSLHLTAGHKKFKPYIYLVSTVLGLFMISVFGVLIVDIIRGFLAGDDTNSSFLINNAELIESVPGGLSTINLLRYILVASVAIYIIPISTYLLLFGNLSVLCEIILGAVSFLFYSPTYLNILNIYSLCRIDDISWGTKGLQSGGGNKNAGLKESWRMIKFVHISKYVIWNVIMSTVLLTIGAMYVPRFFVTFGLVVLIGVTMSLKVIVGTLYMIVYKCKTASFKKKKPSLGTTSRIDSIIDSYQPEIMQEVRDHLNNMKEQYMSNAYLGSFIQAARTRKSIERSFSKQRTFMYKKSGSNLQKKFSISRKFSKEPPSPMSAKPKPINPALKNNAKNGNIPTIREEEFSDKPLVQKPGASIYNLDPKPQQQGGQRPTTPNNQPPSRPSPPPSNINSIFKAVGGQPPSQPPHPQQGPMQGQGQQGNKTHSIFKPINPSPQQPQQPQQRPQTPNKGNNGQTSNEKLFTGGNSASSKSLFNNGKK